MEIISKSQHRSMWIDKSQQEMRTEKFLNEFEICDVTGAWLFTTTGCFNRLNRTRAQQELSLRENQIMSFDYYRSDDLAESVLISYVAELQSMRIPIVEPTLEEYVLNNIRKLDAVDSYVEKLSESIISMDKALEYAMMA